MGESEKVLHDLFHHAMQVQPSMVFLDEIDALFGTRAKEHSTSLHSQLVLELDSFEEIFILAATNRPMDVDPALFRPGRFDLVCNFDFLKMTHCRLFVWHHWIYLVEESFC